MEVSEPVVQVEAAGIDMVVAVDTAGTAVTPAGS